MTPPKLRTGSFAKRVLDARDADVVFVPFFATLSAELQLGLAKGVFRKKVGNEDYKRQREVIDFVKKTEAWNHSGGRDHVFVLTGMFLTLFVIVKILNFNFNVSRSECHFDFIPDTTLTQTQTRRLIVI